MPVRSISQKVAVGVVFVGAMFMSIMDITIVNVALPTIGRTFHVAPIAVDGISISFLVSLAVFIPASGWLGDRFGGRNILLAAIVVFTISSALCGISSSLGELDLFRIFQGVGGGMMAPVGMAMLFRVFPPAERIRASAILTLPTTFAPAIGPVLGGLLVTDLSWRWVFFVNVPIGAAAVIFGMLFLDGNVRSGAGKFDLGGFAFSGIGLGALMYGVSEGPLIGWGSVRVLGTIVIGTALLVGLVFYELRHTQPLIDLRLLTNRMFRSGTIVLILGACAFLGVLYLISLYYQDARGLSALGSGLSTFPEALGVMFGAQISSRLLYRRLGPRRHITMGLVGVAAAMVLLTRAGPFTSLWWVRADLLLLGLSMAQVFVPVQAASFATISHAATGRASTLFNAGRQLGGAVGVALLSTVVAELKPEKVLSGHLAANYGAYHWAFFASGMVALSAVAVSLRIHDSDAAATMVPPPAHGADGRHDAAAATPAVT